MIGVSLFLVFVLAKMFAVWGHAAPLTFWSAVAYMWQDAAVALVFGFLATSAGRIAGAAGTSARATGYWLLVVYAAINIPVGRAVFTPLTRPMLRAARGPLADSILIYITPTNILLMVTVLVAALALPRLMPRKFGAAAAICAVAVITLGPAANARADTRGMDRNVVMALIGEKLPSVQAATGSGDWRNSRYETARAEDLSRYSGSARDFNVVLISLESTAAQYLALYGSPYEVMPNLGALAKNALVFDNAYAVYPESIKGLLSVLCSVYPAFNSRPEEYAHSGCRSIAGVLSEAGYRTAMFHSGRFGYLGMDSIVRNRGYQTLEDAGAIGGNYNSSFGVDEPATVARMLAWLDSLPRGQRFFLNYLPIAGHHPYATPERGPFLGSAEIDQYRNALHYGDASLGKLSEGLRARGLDRNTVWVIYGDHGEAFHQHEGNYGHTFFLYEENVHVPLVVAAPGVMSGQQRVRKIVSLVDLAPTILDLTGIAPPRGYQGRTMLDSAPRIALFFTDYSLGLLGLRDGRWKFIYETGSGRRALFDMDRDPTEGSNLAASYAANAEWYGTVVRGWSREQQRNIASVR